MSQFTFRMNPVLLGPTGLTQRATRGAEKAYQAEVRYVRIGGNPYPYFAITCDGYRRVPQTPRYEGVLYVDDAIFRMESGGCQHDVVAKCWPELRPYLKWHLCAEDGPMHYLANTEYCFRQWDRAMSGVVDAYDAKYSTLTADEWSAKYAEFFRNACVWGALEDDADHPIESFSSVTELLDWLEGRLPELLAKFEHDMGEVQKLNPNKEPS